ncbi:MAG TPA: metabolite traffic protein EboE [Verrucomicrobiales bacterium]|nr:metabolite traffic protein EboE [Verrucomicrobiales bacterium]
MELPYGLHLAYCTNIHRGETWPEILVALERHTLEVRDRVCPAKPYAIGLRLGVQAALTLYDRKERDNFRRWLDRNRCYVFTINGFPYGQFHGTRVKEQVFQPDWSTAARVEYTRALFEIIADIVPPGVAGSVSTVPGSHKELIRDAKQEADILTNLREMGEWIARLSDKTGVDLHLGLEPEPLGYIENTPETLAFFEKLGTSEPVQRCLGVNYDTCHLAIEYEDPAVSLRRFAEARIRLSKLHLSSALRLAPHPNVLRRLRDFQEDVYFHQVIARRDDGSLQRYRDLPDALAAAASARPSSTEEWRVHFHIPLHAPPDDMFQTTGDHLTGALDVLARNPSLCQHLEMETYTWEVLPREMRSATVEDQLMKEYEWALGELGKRKLA